jgi:hypothetical protein
MQWAEPAGKLLVVRESARCRLGHCSALRYPAWGGVKTSIAITVVSLVCAIAFTVVAEKRPTGSGARMAWAALFAIYGVCVGVVSTVLVYFFALGELASLAISVPLGVPALILAAKMSEA